MLKLPLIGAYELHSSIGNNRFIVAAALTFNSSNQMAFVRKQQTPIHAHKSI